MRTAIDELPGSKIREVANAGMGRGDVLAFWFGESDEVTPEFIREAAIDSLRNGETFYAHNLGLPELREAIAALRQRAASAASAPSASRSRRRGVNALMLAMQALVGAGDEVVAVVPVWPNLTAQPAILGAERQARAAARRATAPGARPRGAAATRSPPRTRVLIVNAPNNPTGWTLTRAEQQAILAHCRRTGTWIVADEVYERLYFEPAPHALRAELPRHRRRRTTGWSSRTASRRASS